MRIEAAEVAPRSKTFNGIDRAAGWKPGSARRLFEEGTPPEPDVAPPPPEPIYDRATGEVDRKAALRRLFELVPEIRAAYGDAHADALFDRALELARQDGYAGEEDLESRRRAL